MIEQGAGAWRSVVVALAAAVLAGALGCEAQSASSLSPGSALAPGAAPLESGSLEPGSIERVPVASAERSSAAPLVQHAGADPESTGARITEPGASGTAVTTRRSGTGPARPDVRTHTSAGVITSKHLEAELNRLEAELRN